MPLNFVLPPVEENQEGWGPIAVPPQFEGIPMMPFSKSERLGRIADFGQQAGRGMFAGEDLGGRSWLWGMRWRGWLCTSAAAPERRAAAARTAAEPRTAPWLRSSPSRSRGRFATSGLCARSSALPLRLCPAASAAA